MPNSKKFVALVGRMPFSGRHSVRQNYFDGVRAARRGDIEARDKAAAGIAHISSENTRVGKWALGLASFTGAYGAMRGTWEFTPETLLFAGAAIGHFVSAKAEDIIHDQLQAVSVRSPQEITPQLTRNEPAISPMESAGPSKLELVVSGAARIGCIGFVAHLAVDNLIQRF